MLEERMSFSSLISHSFSLLNCLAALSGARGDRAQESCRGSIQRFKQIFRNPVKPVTIELRNKLLSRFNGQSVGFVIAISQNGEALLLGWLDPRWCSSLPSHIDTCLTRLILFDRLHRVDAWIARGVVTSFNAGVICTRDRHHGLDHLIAPLDGSAQRGFRAAVPKGCENLTITRTLTDQLNRPADLLS